MDVENLQGYDPLQDRPSVDFQPENATWVQAHQSAQPPPSGETADARSATWAMDNAEMSWANPENIAENEYSVLFKGDVIYSGSGGRPLKNVIEGILMDNPVGTDDIVVLKRVALDFGVMLNE